MLQPTRARVVRWQGPRVSTAKQGASGLRIGAKRQAIESFAEQRGATLDLERAAATRMAGARPRRCTLATTPWRRSSSPSPTGSRAMPPSCWPYGPPERPAWCLPRSCRHGRCARHWRALGLGWASTGSASCAAASPLVGSAGLDAESCEGGIGGDERDAATVAVLVPDRGVATGFTQGAGLTKLYACVPPPEMFVGASSGQRLVPQRASARSGRQSRRRTGR